MNSSSRTWNFDFIDWDRLATESTPPDCTGMGETARAWLAAESDENRKAALAFVADALVLRLPWSRSADQNLIPEQIFAALARDAAIALIEQLPRITSAALRTRFVDIAWNKRRACTHNELRSCVAAYLEEAKQAFAPDRWTGCFALLQRAVCLAATLGRKDALLETVLNEVETTIDKANANGVPDPLYLSARLMEILLEYRRGNAKEQAALARQIGEHALATDHDRAITYLEVATRWHQRADQPAEAQGCRERIVDVLEERADHHEPALACHLLEQAVEVARQLPNNQSRTEGLRVKLQQRQRDNVATFAKYESSVDLSDCVADAHARVGGKPTWEALMALCALHQPATVTDVRGRVTELLKESVFRTFIPQVMVSAAGRVLGRNNGAMSDADALLSEMHRDVAFHQQIVARGGIQPALDLLQIEHGLRLEDFLYLAARSPFVPRGREFTFARGLLAGFYGDFSVAAHLLIPQIENGIRLLLEKAGAVTTTLASSGLQNEKDLGQLLEDPKALEIFGEAQVFDFRSLLTEKAGANLRNELAHGLVADGAAHDHCSYLWWVALRLILAPLVRKPADTVPPATDDASTNTSHPVGNSEKTDG